VNLHAPLLVLVGLAALDVVLAVLVCRRWLRFRVERERAVRRRQMARVGVLAVTPDDAWQALADHPGLVGARAYNVGDLGQLDGLALSCLYVTSQASALLRLHPLVALIAARCLVKLRGSLVHL
jgi:hypothetical protein